MAPFGDILATIERARQAAWAERSPLHSAAQVVGGSGGAGGSTGSGSGGAASGGSGGSSGVLHHRQQHGHRGHSMHGAGLPNSHSQPIYVPGKYSVCMMMTRNEPNTHPISRLLNHQHKKKKKMNDSISGPLRKIFTKPTI